ncbi:MAG TPA: DUF835 domain-containing protein [Thermoplasmata archaeon]|jgi:hypothetical protein
MLAIRVVLAAMLSLTLLACAFAAPVAAQGDSVMTVKSKMLLSGVGSLNGGVELEITVAGEAAAALRLAIFNTWDTGDQSLNAAETREFLENMSEALVGRLYWGVTIDSVKNFHDVTGTYVTSHTSGLVSSRWDDTGALMFSLSFDGSGSSETKVIETAQSVYATISGALETIVGFVFHGTMVLEQRVTSLVIGSFTDPVLETGEFSGVRLPTGTILWYSYEGEVGLGARADGTITYRSFSIMESQVIAFIVLVLGAVMVMRTPGKNFDKFEKLHPKKFRKFAKPLLSVRLSAYAITAVLFVLYVLPYAFGFISANALFYAGYLYFLVPLAVVGEYFLAKFMYGRAALSIPDESVVDIKQAVIAPEGGEGEIICKICFRPIEAGLELFQSNCGATMHVDCAERVETCPVCGELLFPQRTRSIECRACGETFLYTGAEDSYSIQCTKCGAFQEEILSGKNYLVVGADPRNAFMMIRAMALTGRPTMCFTAQFPGKIRSDYDLSEVQIKWFSDSETDIDNVNPKNLEGDAMEMASTFLMTSKQAGVLVEGLDILIDANGFDKVLSFAKKINDLAAIHGSTIVFAIDRAKLSEEQYKALSDQFDEIHDFQ